MNEPQQITPEIIESLYEHRIPITHYDVCWALGRMSWEAVGFTGIAPLKACGTALVSMEVDAFGMLGGEMFWHYSKSVWRTE